MDTTTIAGSAAAYLSGDPLKRFELSAVAGDYGADYDLESVNREYVEEVEALLRQVRPDWRIAGDTIFCSHPIQHLSEAERAWIAEEIEAIDVSAILSGHERV